MDATEAEFFRSLYGPRAKAVRRRMSAADAIQLQRLLRVEKDELEGGGVLNDAAWLIRDTTGAMFDGIRDTVQHTAAGARRAIIFVRKLISTLAGIEITVLSAAVVHQLTRFMRQFHLLFRANQEYMQGAARLEQMKLLIKSNEKKLWANILSVPWSEKFHAILDADSLLAAQNDHLQEMIPPVKKLQFELLDKKMDWYSSTPEGVRVIIQQLHQQIGLIGAEAIQGVFLTQGLADVISGFARLVVHLLRTRRGWDIRAKKGKRIAFLGRWVGSVCGVLMTHIMLVHSAAPFATAAVGLVAGFTIIAELFRWRIDLPETSTELMIAVLDQIYKVFFGFPTWALSVIAGDKK